MVRKQAHTDAATINFRHLWGRAKRAELVNTAEQDDATLYQQLTPPISIGLPFMPALVGAEYGDWPLLPDLFPTSFPGVQTKRDDFVIDIEREPLVSRMRSYFDANITDDEMARICARAMDKTNRAFDPKKTRRFLISRGFLPEYIVRYCFHPFDMRWIYWEPETDLLGRKSPDFFPNVFEANLFIEARRQESIAVFARGYVTPTLADNFGNGFSNFFPLYLKNQRATLFDHDDGRDYKPNLSDKAAAYLSQSEAGEQDLFYHAIATLHAPKYRTENGGALRSDWPRVPLPVGADLLRSSAALGRQVAALLDTERPVAGVSAGVIRPELRPVGLISRVGGGSLQPAAGDLDVSAGWGHAGQGGVTMPGKGRVVTRDYAPDELAALETGAAALGLDPAQIRALLGEQTCDIYLNQLAYWKNVPVRVWEYTIGGYQVMKKWLSYRERTLLGRALTVEEVREVTAMARRIAAILLLEPALDANYQVVRTATIDWPNIAA
jgi:hypothetical protein